MRLLALALLAALPATALAQQERLQLPEVPVVGTPPQPLAILIGRQEVEPPPVQMDLDEPMVPRIEATVLAEPF